MDAHYYVWQPFSHPFPLLFVLLFCSPLVPSSFPLPSSSCCSRLAPSPLRWFAPHSASPHDHTTPAAAAHRTPDTSHTPRPPMPHRRQRRPSDAHQQYQMVRSDTITTQENTSKHKRTTREGYTHCILVLTRFFVLPLPHPSCSVSVSYGVHES